MLPQNVPTPTAAVSENSGSPAWPVFNLNERRVLGVLIEKAKTTPDAYPLSLNALVAGCNQKSNREPLLNLTDVEIEEALAGLLKHHLVARLQGGRVERWRHLLYEAWHVNKVELAILAELLLRGPQTEGELRGRASRMEPLDDLDALRAVLRGLAQRGLVVYLTPEGRRGTTVTHGFHATEEIEHLRQNEETPSDVPRGNTAPALEERLNVALAEIEMLRASIAELRSQVDDLEAQMNSLRASLGG